MTSRPRVGTYFYPWYNAQRWHEAPCPSTPTIGEYQSNDSSVVEWQIEQILEASIDYVVFEIVPAHDWCFDLMAASIECFIEKARSTRLSWSFLIDTRISPGPVSAVDDVLSIVAYLERRGWTKEMEKGPSDRPLLFHFGPLPHDAHEITQRLRARFEMVFPAYIPHWGHPDTSHALPVFDDFAHGAGEKGMTVEEFLTERGYAAFWHSTMEITCHRGFCAVEPGYNDMLLKRNPQLAPVVERENGDHYRKRLRQAFSMKPDHILIYSWNEYFEGTEIEPTQEHGSLYVDLTREAVKEMS